MLGVSQVIVTNYDFYRDTLTKKMFHVILAVTSQHSGKDCSEPSIYPKKTLAEFTLEKKLTLLKSNITLEGLPFQKECNLPTIIFSRVMLNFEKV